MLSDHAYKQRKVLPKIRPRGGITSFLPCILISRDTVVPYDHAPAQASRGGPKNARKTLQPKDKVVTIGGIIATIQKVENDTVVLNLGKEMQMEVRKSAIASKLGRRTGKAIRKRSKQ
ncbi:MAG: preprotein translocase subunit YajC [Candidatus Marinimicrobia bacterium]|nr:preprotein translocase subunit YajC [Candidatus Neomarinimicrobiota bacterium]